MSSTWREFRSYDGVSGLRGHDTWKTHAADPTSEQDVLDRAHNEELETEHAEDRQATEAMLTRELEAGNRDALYARVVRVLTRGAQLSADQWLADMQEKWGDAMVLRALASVVERSAQS